MSAVAVAPEATHSSLADLVLQQAALHPDLSDHALAERTLAEIESPPGEALLMTLPAVTRYVLDIRRRSVRRRERRLTKGWRPSASSTARREAALGFDAKIAAYGEEHVSIPGRGRARAGGVTVAEWEMRCEMIQDGIDSDQGTLEFTRRIVGLLQAGKVETLDEYLGAQR
jgi:hypothetical protein